MSQLNNESFDPFAEGLPGWPYLGMIFDTLVGANKAGNAISKATGLAQEWTVAPDNMAITFTLRDAKFSNGSPVTSADVAFSLAQNRNPQAGSANAKLVASLITAVETPDPRTVVVRIKSPVPSQMLSLLSPMTGTSEGMVIPQAVYQSMGSAAFARAPIGSGPYTASGYKPGAEISLTARNDYWGGAPRVRELVFNLIPDENARVNALKTGQVDFIGTSRPNLPVLQSAGFTPYVKPAGDQLMLYTPWDGKGKDPIVGNPKVREALSLAINREELNKSLFAGYGKPSGNFNTSVAFGYKPIPPDPYDPARARQLLQEAGISPSQINIDFQAWASATAPEGPRAAEAIAGYWQAIGVQSKITLQSYPAYREKWGARTMSGPTLSLQSMPGSPLPSGLMALTMSCDGGLPLGCDPAAVEPAIKEMNSATSDQALAAAITKAEQAAAAQRMYIGLLEIGAAYVGNNKVAPDYSPGVMYDSFNTRGLVGIGS